MAADPTWDFLDLRSRGRLLGVLRTELDGMLELAAPASRWHVPTACPGWELRDMAGHLVDATESYLLGFDRARRGVAGGEPIGVAGMAEASDTAARAFRRFPQDELVQRLRVQSDRLLHEFDSLSDTDWSGLSVHDRYLGAFPPRVLAEALLGGYTVHGWDVRQGLGGPHSIAGDAADLLVPFTFLFWRATADVAALDEPFEIGIRTYGRNGGDTKVEVSDQGLQFGAGDIDRCQTTLEFDPGTLVLTAYGRINGGTVRGDPQLADRFRSLFISI
ncbi:MAG TPA: maleylpyruvate isomerase family mycothiol-dependent enzyme [Acidimicrobiia bacterium]